MSFSSPTKSVHYKYVFGHDDPFLNSAKSKLHECEQTLLLSPKTSSSCRFMDGSEVCSALPSSENNFVGNTGNSFHSDYNENPFFCPTGANYDNEEELSNINCADDCPSGDIYFPSSYKTINASHGPGTDVDIDISFLLADPCYHKIEKVAHRIIDDLRPNEDDDDDLIDGYVSDLFLSDSFEEWINMDKFSEEQLDSQSNFLENIINRTECTGEKTTRFKRKKYWIELENDFSSQNTARRENLGSFSPLDSKKNVHPNPFL